MGKSRVVDTDRGYRAFKRRLNAAKGYSVKVGVIDDHPHDGSDEGLTVAEVAAINEYGTDRIPARPALRIAVDSSKPAVRRLARAETEALVDGRRTPEQALGRIGAFMAGQMQRSIIDLDTPPNAPRTIAQKGSSNPLVDTGQYVNSISWEVVRGKARARADAQRQVGSGS